MTSFDRDIQLRALLKVASDLESAISLCPYIEFEDVQRLHELMSQVQEILQTIRNEAQE
jgi:hypothetical protein